MADYVDSMTNAELQSKLTDYGLPKVPVTTATRKVLEKKLKSLLAKGSPPTAHKEDKVQPGASGDKDQGGNTPIKQKEKNRRRTTIAKTQDVVENQKVISIIEDTKVIPSTMDKVEEMSDEDLRTKLTEHGYPLMPVTAATRGLLEKKLKSILYGNKIKDTTDSKDKKPLSAVELKVEETKTKRSRHTIASENDSKVNVDKKRPIVDERKLEDTKNKTKRSRYTIASEDVVNIDSNYERPKKISRLSVQSSTFASSSTETPFDPISSIRSAYGTNLPLGSQTTRRKYDLNNSNTAVDSQASIDRIEYPIRNSIPSKFDFSKTINVESATDRKSQNFIDTLNSFSNLTSISSFAKTSSPSSYHPNINFSTNQPSTSGLHDSDSPFLSEFGRRLHAEKLRAKTNSN